MRQTGDIGCIPIRVWESGVFDLVPDCDRPRHGRRGARRRARRGAAARRRASGWCRPVTSRSRPQQHLQFLDHLATLHAATWGWQDDVGLLPAANRYSFFGPDALECEAALGFPQPVPRIATEGWRRLDDASPELADALRPLRRAPWPLFDALAETPTAFLHGDTKFGNLGIRRRRPHDPHRLVADRRRAHRSPRSCTRSRSTGPASRRSSRATPPSTRTAPRSNATASTPRRGSNVSSRCASWA